MFQYVRIDDAVLPALLDMFDRLGEGSQVLTADSPHPLVRHGTMGQLTLIRRGHGYITIAGHHQTIGPGDLFIMAPGCPHAFRCLDGELELGHWHWPQELLDTDREILEPAFAFAADGAETAR
ncbi:AraC family ligand binding domain-containing protein [Dactylosporangium sp. NPDC051485]|uniref:AraC family ligand binding domain-containing protein n=1 Tax=Dactylosporangium sp. NPDC051485 TaxID=3154846 RepID=UPI003443B481